MTTLPAKRSVLRDPTFLRLWLATTSSTVATWALAFVLGLAVLDRTLSAGGLGVVLAARTVGFLVAVPIGGILADRYPRQTVVFWSCALAVVSTPVLAFGGLPLMVCAAAVLGAGQGACRPAFQALTAEVVRASQRQRANAAMTFAVRASTLIAPALTALLATVVSTSGLLLGTCALWLIAALVPPRGADQAKRERDKPHREFLEGLQEARRHPWFLAGLAALSTVTAFGQSAISVALPLVSRDRYGTEAVLAAGVTAYSVGALIGALIIARWRPRNQGWAALAGLALFGFAPLSMLMPVHPVVIVAAFVAVGIGIELFNVPWFTATQREVEPGKLARVSSLDFLFSYGLAPIGLAVIAPAIGAFGLSAVLAVCAVVCFLAPAAAALVPSSRHLSVVRTRRSA
ncbi:MFS transporter [Kibdelosporangium phytohabitans]|uniref:MFS transporter n=1 Tax=Kibdelosporangium phytohabitans TaxID=860235 RepID=A0A0N9IA73_9PSEU|nr:MFS transporter [Kibdelosporangium phytohabitans]ALG11362.1 MFS transporter [Kibdelosporangium phytohabitans]MBE1462683.1 MFS family permease [Kibdelosporangium phytohabitans]